MTPLVVLYAENDEDDVFFMERAFTRLKCRDALRVVENGRQATHYLLGVGRFADRATHPLPRVLVLDMKMPEMTGLEVLRWVRAHTEFAALPIIMFTSSIHHSDMAACRAMGANAYLVKPPDAAHLAALMSEVIQAVASPVPPAEPLPISGNHLLPPR